MIPSSEIEQVVKANWQKHLEWLQTLVRFPSQCGREAPLSGLDCRFFPRAGNELM